jgi:glycosyltransferase involved in cell wall biosynthesis|tara:strand:+ start:2363 stop:3628 length:1266 start_codon:yes stop_codon:yes gene_type:complete
MKKTVIISCPVDTYSGYGARGRDVVKAFHELGDYDVKVLQQRWGDTPWGFIDDHEEEWGFLNPLLITPETGKLEQPDIWVQITIPNEFMPQGKFNIGITAGIESNLAPADWLEGCNRMNLVLGSSQHTINVLKASKWEQKDEKTGQKRPIAINQDLPMEVLFEGFNEKVYNKTTEKLDLPEIKEQFCFLFTGMWIQGDYGHDRKNIGVMIKTFLETFKNKQKQPALILKTSVGSASYSSRQQILKSINNIKAQIKGKLPKIYLIHGDLTDEEMNQLYNHPQVKCMVSATKGEGFGRPLLEFTQTKKPIIASGWSGHVDFLKPDMSYLIQGKLHNVHPSAANKWLVKESQWFDIDVVALNNAFKTIYLNYKDWSIKSKKQGNFAKENFSYTAMKEKLGNILEEKTGNMPQHIKLELPKLQKT